VIDVFLIPFLAGIIVSLIFGFGGKWLAHLPPLIVRSVSYFALAQHMTTIAPGSSLIPIGWWGFFLILTVEFCAVGGVIGEVMVKRTYGALRCTSRSSLSDRRQGSFHMAWPRFVPPYCPSGNGSSAAACCR